MLESESKHTSLLVRIPTTCGPTNPGMVAAAFVKPNIVPIQNTNKREKLFISEKLQTFEQYGIEIVYFRKAVYALGAPRSSISSLVARQLVSSG